MKTHLTYTLTSTHINPGTHNSTATSGWRINVDGTVDQNVNGTWSQIFASTDWAIPNDHGAGNHYVRWTGSSGDTINRAGAFLGAVNVWTELTASGTLTITDGSGLPGVKNGEIYIELATDSGGTDVVATATIELTADYQTG